MDNLLKFYKDSQLLNQNFILSYLKNVQTFFKASPFITKVVIHLDDDEYTQRGITLAFINNLPLNRYYGLRVSDPPTDYEKTLLFELNITQQQARLIYLSIDNSSIFLSDFFTQYLLKKNKRLTANVDLTLEFVEELIDYVAEQIEGITDNE